MNSKLLVKEDDSFDVQESARWNAYCSLKEILPQDIYIENFGGGTFNSFNDVIDAMIREE